MRFDFAFATDAVFGVNRYQDVPQLLIDRGWTRPGLVIDRAVAATHAARDLVERLKSAFGEPPLTCEADTRSEPDYDYLDQCTSFFRGGGLDCLIGVGGGSAMDLCKGICVLLTNPGRGVDYRGFDRVKEPGIPAVLIPTTAGTGSETTPTAVFIHRETRTKLGINGRHVAPRLAVLDPALTASCPHAVAVGSGLDAVVHSLEAFMTCREHPIAHGLSVQALSHLLGAFPAAVNDPAAHDARLEMLLGAYVAGITLRSSGGGVAGALSYPLGAEFGVPHGLAGGLLIPAIVRLNMAGGYPGFDALEQRLSLEEEGRGTAPPAGFLDRITKVFADIRAPDDLSAYPVRRRDIPHIVEQSITQRSGALSANPVPADESFLAAVLESVIVE